MKSLTDIVKDCVTEGTGAPDPRDSQRDQDQTGRSAGSVKKVAGKGLWQDVEFVPMIVEKMGD